VWRPKYRSNPREAVAWNESVLEYIREHRIPNVVLVARWAVNVEGRTDGKTDSLIANVESNEVSPLMAQRALEAGLTRTLDELESLGVKVFIVKQVPEQSYFSPQRTLVRSAYLGGEPPKGVAISEHDARQSSANEIITACAQGRDFVRLVDPKESCFDTNGYSLLGNEHGSFYRDADHLSDFGADSLLRPLLDSVFTEMVESRRSGEGSGKR
jgi:hypothetical protein